MIEDEILKLLSIFHLFWGLLLFWKFCHAQNCSHHITANLSTETVDNHLPSGRHPSSKTASTDCEKNSGLDTLLCFCLVSILLGGVLVLKTTFFCRLPDVFNQNLNEVHFSHDAVSFERAVWSNCQSCYSHALQCGPSSWGWVLFLSLSCTLLC